MLERLAKLEPAMVVGAITSTVGLLAALGLAIDGRAVASIGSVVGSILMILQALVTRGQVVPVAKVEELMDHPSAPVYDEAVHPPGE